MKPKEPWLVRAKRNSKNIHRLPDYICMIEIRRGDAGGQGLSIQALDIAVSSFIDVQQATELFHEENMYVFS